MLFIAHRGDHINYPENSLKAFKKAIKNPLYVGFELDVRETKDKRYVVNHNLTFKGKRIKNTKYKNLKKKGILALNEVLKVKHQKIVLIEIKDYYIDYEVFINLIKKYKINCYIMTFYNHHLTYLKNKFHKIGSLNYYLNNINNYSYPFICLLSFSSNNYIDSFLRNDIEVFLYGLFKIKKHRNDVYLIVDKIF